MSNELNDVFTTMLSKLESFANTETVLGKPIEIGEMTIIPITKVSLGFGGGGGGSEKEGNGVGAGAGISVSPVAFIVACNNEVKLLPVKQKAFGSLIDGIPDLVTKLAEMKMKKEEPKKDDSESED